MKFMYKTMIVIIMMMLIHTNTINAQENGMPVKDSVKTESKLSRGKIEPYWLSITYDKTTHLIFPSKIKYVDLGSEYLIAGKAEGAENVLRIKAAVKDFEGETNFSVVTEDGKFYSFNIFYSHYPATLNYDVQTMLQSDEREKLNEVLFEDLGTGRPSLTEAAMKTIYKKNKKIIRHIAAESFGITFLLKSIYIHEGKYYMHFSVKNTSNVPFPVDFISFKIVDQKTAKRTTIQEKELVPLRFYLPFTMINGNSEERNIYLLDQFTLDDEKMLVIELFEKNGGRHQRIEVQNADLINARLLTELKLIF